MSARTLLIPGLAAASVVLTVLAVPTGSAFAQQQMGARAEQARAKFEQRFNAADTDHDGTLSREEAKAGMPNVYKHFDEIDTAKRGVVSKEEIGAYLEKKAQQHRGMHQGG